MESDTSTNRDPTSRRKFLGTATAVITAAALESGSVTAQARSSRIKAVAFDAFAIFDSRSVFHLAEQLLPGRGVDLSNAWRTRQFEYTWLRNSMHQYADFWHVTQDALNYAAKRIGVQLEPTQNEELMAAFLDLKPWPDAPAVLESLQEQGFRLALLSNMTSTMMQSCVKTSGLQAAFEFELSTDRVKAFKPDPAAYRMAPETFRMEKDQIAFVAFGGWDAAGAKTFGYSTYWVNRLGAPVEQLGAFADATGRDLSSLPAFLDTLPRT